MIKQITMKIKSTFYGGFRMLGQCLPESVKLGNRFGGWPWAAVAMPIRMPSKSNNQISRINTSRPLQIKRSFYG